MSPPAPIEHIPIDLGLGEGLHFSGRLRVSGRFDYAQGRPIDELIAEFGLGADFSRFVRIEFSGPSIVRVLDEAWLSTASDPRRWRGDLKSFARQVVGGDFSRMHEAFFFNFRDAAHYQFVTVSACLDVLAASPPRFSLLGPSESEDSPPSI